MSKFNVGDNAVINNNVAPIYLNPRSGSELADEGLYGMTVKILEVLDDCWYHIETHYGYKGYMHEGVLFGDKNEVDSWNAKCDSYIISSFADVLDEPDYIASIMNLLTRGAFVHITGLTQEKWMEIELVNGKRGWIRSGCAVKMQPLDINNDEETIRDNFVKTAKLYLGTQYRWGGKSTLGIDCSGLTSMTYMLNGFIIYRDGILTKEHLKEINRNELKKGDLLFSKGHITMYIGNDQYIHSTGREGYVLINSLNKDHEDYREDLDIGFYAFGTIFGR